jgi:hypothetical protein
VNRFSLSLLDSLKSDISGRRLETPVPGKPLSAQRYEMSDRPRLDQVLSLLSHTFDAKLLVGDKNLAGRDEGSLLSSKLGSLASSAPPGSLRSDAAWKSI